ncbi:hypothetical protein [Spirosoma luteum]|uniref:hypothetical protein n=1 Tax=Spirosoma luteum TaxID=431553 RepID=UPI00036245BD|nr:hypothetical protein [Spirosoma luteum]
MKKLLLPFVFLVLLFGCTKSIYHVATVQSEQVKLVDKDFVFENEHLRVVYNLWEPGGRMRFLLFNKTDQPIYIDWGKSQLTRNDTTLSYSQLPPLPKRAYADTVRYVYRSGYVEPYRMTARANRVAEIPSQTFVAIADFPIQQAVLHQKTNQKNFTYTKENSPLRVGQQLCYSFDKEGTNAHSIAHSFWVNQIQVVGISELTRLFGSRKTGQPNALYTVESRPEEGRTVLLGLGVVSVSIYMVMKGIESAFSSISICC